MQKRKSQHQLHVTQDSIKLAEHQLLKMHQRNSILKHNYTING